MSVLSEEHQRFQRWILEVIDADAVELATRWLAHLVAHLPQDPARVFPSDTLLDHIPSLIRRLSPIAFGEADSPDHRFVEREIRQLAEMRRAQGYEIEELQTEFDLLSEVILTHLEARVHRDRVQVAPAVALATWRQLNAALDRLGRSTARVFRERIAADRLERARLIHAFCRALSHELRNRLNVSNLALQFVGKALERGMDPSGGIDRLRSGLRRAEGLIEDVYTLAAAHGPIDVHTGLGRHLPEIVHEVTSSLASMAAAREVALEAPDLPVIQVDAGRVQLILVCLVAHAVRESAPARANSRVRVSADQGDAGRWVITVQDDAPPVPDTERARLFDGPGLRLAQETASQLGTEVVLAPAGERGNRYSFTVTQAGDQLVAPGRSLGRDESTES